MKDCNEQNGVMSRKIVRLNSLFLRSSEKWYYVNNMIVELSDVLTLARMSELASEL